MLEHYQLITGEANSSPLCLHTTMGRCLTPRYTHTILQVHLLLPQLPPGSHFPQWTYLQWLHNKTGQGRLEPARAFHGHSITPHPILTSPTLCHTAPSLLTCLPSLSVL